MINGMEELVWITIPDMRMNVFSLMDNYGARICTQAQLVGIFFTHAVRTHIIVTIYFWIVNE